MTATSPPVATVKQVQAALRPDEALLSYAADSVLVITTGTWSDLPLREPIDAAPRDAHALYGLAMHDALEGLPPGITHLTVVPDGSLATAQLAALGPDGGPALFERYALSMVPSASHLVALRKLPRREGDDQVLVVADTSVPGARTEASAIAARFGQRSSTRLGEGATEGALLYLAPEYGLLHVAARAVSRDDRADVMLAADERGDGVLSAPEVVAYGLDRPVVVLANAAPSDDSGPWPLARAWLEAGARAVVVPMAPLADEAATPVVVTLHQRFAAGADVATALATAQRQAGGPVGLVVIGDGAAVPFEGGLPAWPSAWLWWGTLGVLGVVLGAGVLAGRVARRQR